jgi:hypothetical protein
VSNVASTCGGPSIGITTPQFTLAIPCLFSITLPSFSFSISLPTFSIVFFRKLFFNLNICDLSIAFDMNAGASVPAFGGCIQNCVPDPSLAEQTYAVVAA